MKRAQAMGNELALAQVNLSLATLTSHLISMHYYSQQDGGGENETAGMVKSMSVKNLSHFQQIQHRKLQLEAATTNNSTNKSAEGAKGEDADGPGKHKYALLSFLYFLLFSFSLSFVPFPLFSFCFLFLFISLFFF